MSSHSDRTGAPRRVEVIVHGRVQGVGFRVFATRVAARNGVTGWIANDRGGTVRGVGEGQEGDLRAWLDELRAGPPGGYVDRLDEAWSEASGRFDDFEIRSGWHAGD